MNRSLLGLALSVALFTFAAPGYSMTATVTSTAQPAAAPSAPGAAKTSTATTSATTSDAAKPTVPSASSVTRPAAVLSAPGVPAKFNAAPGKAATPRSTHGPILPSVAPQSVPRPPNSAAWAATATSDNSTGMRKGTLQAFNAGAGAFQVYGQKLTFNPQRVKVFNAGGKPASVFSLKTGASVRFTLDPADLQHRRVAVIYTN
jgi:hypothetical protein